MPQTITFQDYLNNAGPLPILIGLFVLGIPTILASLLALLNIRNHFKKTPPDHETYATKKELADVEKRLNTQLADGATLFQSIQRELATIAAQTAETRGYLKSLSEHLNKPKTTR